MRDRGVLMPFEDLASRLEDILDTVDNISAFVAGRSLDDYRADTMLPLAIAAYQTVDPHIMWAVATEHVSGLREAVQQILSELDAGRAAGRATS
jgi:uncharacterized protein with HEPN domain